MSQSDPYELDTLRLEELLVAYSEQSIDPEQLTELEQMLSSNEEAVGEYWRQMDLHARLQWRFSEKTPLYKLEEVQTLTSTPRPKLRSTATRNLRLNKWSLAVAIAAVLLVAPLLWRNSEFGNSSPLDSAARLTAVEQCVWRRGFEPQDVVLNNGDELLLESGRVEVTLVSGARVNIWAPARFDVLADNRFSLQSGRLMADVPHEAIGFTVETPSMKVVDFGTQFGVSVGPNKIEEVHTIAGMVKVSRTGESGETWHEVSAGQAIQMTARGHELVDIEVDESRFQLHADIPLAIDNLLGQVRYLTDPPVLLAPGGLESDSYVYLIQEKTGVELPQTLPEIVTRDHEGLTWFKPLSETPAGTRLDSYLLHFDPFDVGGVRDKPVEQSGVITFRSPIVAVFAGAEMLYATDELFGSDEVVYAGAPHPQQSLRGAWGGERGMGTNREFLTVSEDRKTIRFRFAIIEEGYDQVRILTPTDSVDQAETY